MIQDLRVATIIAGVLGAIYVQAGMVSGIVSDTAGWLAMAPAALAYNRQRREVKA